MRKEPRLLEKLGQDFLLKIERLSFHWKKEMSTSCTLYGEMEQGMIVMVFALPKISLFMCGSAGKDSAAVVNLIVFFNTCRCIVKHIRNLKSL